MKPRKVAILGGGVAALSTAYQLTRTEALRAEHDVTVYQIGWRLGGKGATGRRDGRIEEHGLHVWFGFYDNAFRMLRDVYRDWQRAPENPLKHWRDAFKPQSFTPIGPDLMPFNWPQNDGVPGDGHIRWTPWQAFTEVLGLVAAVVESWHDEQKRKHGPDFALAPVTVPAPLTALLAGVHPDLAPAAVDSGGASFQGPHHALRVAHQAASRIGASHHGTSDETLRALAALAHHGHRAMAATTPATAVDGHDLVTDLLDLFQAFARGVVEDLLIAGRTARELDREEFRDWLMRHGGTAAVVRESFIVRALYDTMFQYREGDGAAPDYAAGTALQVILRMFGGYKGAALYMMQAGMGEVVIAPLYELLKARGVRFEFFSEVTRLQLDPSRRRVERVHITRQAQVRNGDYHPTFDINGLICWPSEPFWAQLEDGDRLRAAGVDFESPWSDRGTGQPLVLNRGSDFDQVVLGISLGAFKKLNDDPGLADELIAASAAFRAMTERLGLVPSMAVQLWSARSLHELGWELEPPAAVAGVEPLDIWADMTPTLHYEAWTGLEQPQSVHYLTGVMKSQAFRRPRRDRHVQQAGERELFDISVDWLEGQGPRLWPAAVSNGGFDWNVLFDPAAAPAEGPARLHAQYLRANISPTECCVGSGAGTTRYRLRAGDSGFENLKLTGCWIDTGFNTTCIEAAVMSGMQAARAISGEPAQVLGEDFLQRPGHALGAAPSPLEVLGSAVARVMGGMLAASRLVFSAIEGVLEGDHSKRRSERSKGRSHHD